MSVLPDGPEDLDACTVRLALERTFATPVDRAFTARVEHAIRNAAPAAVVPIHPSALAGASTWLLRAALVASVTVTGVTGLGVAAASAQQGDPLHGVRRIIEAAVELEPTGLLRGAWELVGGAAPADDRPGPEVDGPPTTDGTRGRPQTPQTNPAALPAFQPSSPADPVGADGAPPLTGTGGNPVEGAEGTDPAPAPRPSESDEDDDAPEPDDASDDAPEADDAPEPDDTPEADDAPEFDDVGDDAPEPDAPEPDDAHASDGEPDDEPEYDAPEPEDVDDAPAFDTPEPEDLPEPEDET